jgi:ABC-type multidrug transport system ATPase subunit
MENVIETISLVKRYPTNVSKDRGSALHGLGGGGASSFGGILRLLRGNNGSFNYALRGVDLAVRKGEIFGVLGPNGAGKTTLIKVLCTLVIHDEGEAYVCGIDVKKQPGKVLKNLQGVLPESRGFAWRLTGLQNLEFYALLYGLSDDKAKERARAHLLT